MRCLVVLLLFVKAAFSLSIDSPESYDCVSAELLCKNDTVCNSTYSVLKNCTRGDAGYPTTAPECQEAGQRISQTPIYHCKCHHQMRKEELCLNIYWTVHVLYIPGYLVSADSPYGEDSDTNEQTKNLHFRSLFEPEFLDDTSNACVKEANTCGSNERCTQLKSEYVSHCSMTKGSCDRRKCHSQLRNFIRKVPIEFTKRLLFCPCDQDKNCGERRRQNIVPKCSFEEKEMKNCLEIYDICMGDNLCKSRLLDYQKHCHLFEKNIEGCSPKQHDLCMKAYIRMIGTAATPNFINNMNMDTSLWCTCEGSANKLEVCNAFRGMFTSNRCLQKVISSDLNQSIPMTVNNELRSSPEDKSDTMLAVRSETEKQRPPDSASSILAPSWTLLGPALLMWLLKVVSFM
ncbi:hypothetical protein GDO81_010514 [Engystomops pustulosus]|uniref:GDNF/GAS1 domain-containing protein n=1 Tax=Engystomops pustulosus TaxID=76066 RepID=A0AAV7C0Q2_ENGPU|nr:hypothetical protein GDO81_010514 [Engystomops pustulosus]